MDNTRIPKLIHLTWFSGDPYPPLIEACLKTWKEVLPDYEIKVWDMKMARSLHIPYVDEALDCKKWAFAGDVVRAYAVYTYGGIYMDTDIYVLKSFDNLLNNRLVLFNEYNKDDYNLLLKNKYVDKEGKRLDYNALMYGIQIQAAFFMGEKGHPYLKDVIDYYRGKHFLGKDGKPDISVISPLIYAEVLVKYGYKYKNEPQSLREGIQVRSYKEVAGDRYLKYPESIAIHCVNHSWAPKTFNDKLKTLFKRLIGWRNNKAVILPEYF